MVKKQDAHANNEEKKKELGGDGENIASKSIKAEEENKQNEEKVVIAKEDEENASIFYEIDCFIAIVLSLKGADAADNQPHQPPALPDSPIDKFLSMVEKDLSKHDSRSGCDKFSVSLLDGIDHLHKLSTALSSSSSTHSNYKQAANRTSTILQRAMSFLEEEFKILLDDPKIKEVPTSRPSSSSSFKPSRFPDPESCDSPAAAVAAKDSDVGSCREDSPPPSFPPEIIDKLRRIADIMISAGYESECCQAFSIARHNAFEAALSKLAFHRITLDDVQKMQWESLQAEIATWIQAFRQSISIFFPRERNLCESVFSKHKATGGSLFNNLARSILIQLLNFAEAVAVTKGSAEKLFKFLDMYEALRDMLPEMDVLFPGNEEATDLKSEISTAQSRLGETAAAIFCELEGSIKADVAKTPVPGGAVHPLTRYVMNYLKYACEYKKTLEQVLMENQTHVKASPQHTPLATQLIGVMELLDSNLELKSKLYKEMALANIFLMNNGRYIVKKIKESTEIYELVGDNWYRKQSGELRQYHKNYQRETWSKVLGIFKEEGLQVKGSVSKSAVKERMKSFTAMFEEIHKTQSTWLVSDEQLKSELRVSITAVLVPAYRSFLGRYKQHLSERQSEKYIKFGPEDIEAKIEELFEGNPSNIGHGRKK